MATNLSDLEMTKLCAEAMGWTVRGEAHKWIAWKANKCAVISTNDKGGESVWDPLHDDAQALALLKRFKLDLDVRRGPKTPDDDEWGAHFYKDGELISFAQATGLNRAIVECVAKMQLAVAP